MHSSGDEHSRLGQARALVRSLDTIQDRARPVPRIKIVRHRIAISADPRSLSGGEIVWLGWRPPCPSFWFLQISLSIPSGDWASRLSISIKLKRLVVLVGKDIFLFTTIGRGFITVTLLVPRPRAPRGVLGDSTLLTPVTAKENECAALLACDRYKLSYWI